eukprot:UN11979
MEFHTNESAMEFLAKYAKKYGKMLKGGEPDFHNCAVMILHDWQRGKLPWFVCPPFEDDLEKRRGRRNAQRRGKKEKGEGRRTRYGF